MAHDLNPAAYLRHGLEEIADRHISRISELLPWNVKDGIAAEAISH